MIFTEIIFDVMNSELFSTKAIRDTLPNVRTAVKNHVQNAIEMNHSDRDMIILREHGVEPNEEEMETEDVAA